MILFWKSEGCVPNESAKEEGDEAGEEVNVVGMVWFGCESAGTADWGRKEKVEKGAVRVC